MIRANYLAHMYEKRFYFMIESATRIAAGAKQLLAYNAYEEQRNAASKIAATYKMRQGYQNFQSQKRAVTSMAACVKMFQQRKRYLEARRVRRENASTVMQSIVRTFLIRSKFIKRCRRVLPRYAAPVIQRAVRNYQRKMMLNRLAAFIKKLNGAWFSIDWPSALERNREFSLNVKKFYVVNRARYYRMTLTEPNRVILTEKERASDLFRNKKASYLRSVPDLFKGDIARVSGSPKWAKLQEPSEKVISALPVEKVNKKDLKRVARILVLTNAAVHIIDKDFVSHGKFPLSDVQAISCSPHTDAVLIIHFSNSKKGDLVLVADKAFVCPSLLSFSDPSWVLISGLRFFVPRSTSLLPAFPSFTKVWLCGL